MPPSKEENDSASGEAREGAALTRRIFVRELELIGSVGVYEHEHRYEQRIVVSLDLEIDDGHDGGSDALERVYDYDRAITAIKSTVDSGHFNLLETLAERVAAACLADPRVLEARVTIAKPDVLPVCRAVGVEIVRRRL